MFIPWIPTILRQLRASSDIGWLSSKPTILTLAQIFLSFNSWISPDLETRTALRSMNLTNISSQGLILVLSIFLLAFILLIYFIFGILKYKNKSINFTDLKNKNILFLLMWILIPIIIPFIASYILKGPALGPTRYVLFVSPAYYIIAAKGIYEHKKHIVALLLLILFSLYPIYSFYVNFDKQQWKETAKYLYENRDENELVIIHAYNTYLPLSYYYTKLDNVKNIKSVEEVKQIIKSKNSFWLILAQEKYSDPKNTIKSYLDANYKIDKQIELTGVKIFHYS